MIRIFDQRRLEVNFWKLQLQQMKRRVWLVFVLWEPSVLETKSPWLLDLDVVGRDEHHCCAFDFFEAPVVFGDYQGFLWSVSLYETAKAS